MIEIRKAGERGHFDHGWLNTNHTFSFADYHDPENMGWGPLRVLNEDTVAPGAGFPSHAHRDMEILTWVLEGALQHRDSMGNGSVIRPGEVQRMSAGTGVTHSEHNASQNEPVHFMQIWILPERRGLAPGYEQKRFSPAAWSGRLSLVGSPDGRDGSVTIHQDAFLYAALLASGEAVQHAMAAGRKGWVQVARGGVKLNGSVLGAGDGARIAGEKAIQLLATDDSHVLLFDLAS
jgi:redox-sensitive bicupin YhaK (pirin superfamily)